MKTRLMIAAVAALALSFQVAAAPRYENIVLSDTKGGGKVTTFTPTTARVYLNAKLVDVKSGSTLKSEWIAEKTKVAPPDYKIDAAEVKVGPLMNNVDFSMTKPTAGWPVGDYRVDLFIDGKPAGKMKFQVK
jgi:hypothetical protein